MLFYCRFKEGAQLHEQQRLRENFELLMSRCDTLLEHKTKLEEDLNKCTNQHRLLERELNSVKPELLKLYRRRERIQRALTKKGLSADAVQKLIQDVKLVDENDVEWNCAPVNIESSASSASASSLPHSPDYIPPHGPFEDKSTWLVEGYSKQGAVNLLSGARDGTFLIRPSETKAGFYALSLVCRNKVHNCLIECRDGMYGFAGTDVRFKSLVEFVVHYSYNSLKDHNPDLDATLRHPVMLERS